MICITCGRDNPAHLIFCQECGQRLTAQVVPTTPVVGLAPGPSPYAAPRPPEGQEPQPQFPRPPSFAPQRPPAPQVNFAGQPDPDRGADGSPTGQDAPACPLCGNRNPRSLRFCVTCGHLLAQSSIPPPSVGAAPSGRAYSSSAPPRGPDPPPTIRPPAPEALANTTAAPGARSPLPPAAAPPAPIEPARVVEVGAPGAGEAMLRLCPRCRGGSDPTSQFCRFCGTSLADATSISLAPRTPLPPDPSIGVSPAPISMRTPSNPVRSTVAMVSPAAGPVARARLVLIARDGGEGPGYPIGDSTDIGRTEGNIIVGDDRYVSPRHARIQARSGGYYLRDLGSTNGIYVRIPFSRPNDARPGPRWGGTAAAGGGASAPGEGGVEPPLEQTLAQTPAQTIVDQDLFLIGQQVLKFEVVKHAEEGFGVASDNGTLLFGTPAAPRYGRLSQRTVEGVVRDVFHLQKIETIIGRELGDLVFTEDPFLSRRHAAIVVQGMTSSSKGQPRRFSLMDLGSSNGTFLQLREEIRLKNGDHLRIGQQLFRFDLDRADA